MSLSQPTSTPEPGMPEFAQNMERLRGRLTQMRALDLEVSDSPVEVVGDLETAYEELRVADEEVRVQRDQIGRLLDRNHVLHWQHERMLALLPVAAFVTDGHGMIRHANAAAAALVSAEVSRLLGKPLFSLFDPPARRALRDLIRIDNLHNPGPCAVTLRSRTGESIPIDVSVTIRPTDGREITWLMLTKPGLPEPDLARVTRALIELTGLPGASSDRHGVLRRAVHICREALDGLDVTIMLGPPESPDMLASTSSFAQDLDGAQLRADQGPSMTAFHDSASITSVDIANDLRWPHLAEAMQLDQPTGVVAAPIEVGARRVGVLTLYVAHGRPVASVEREAELLAAALGAVVYELELSSELAELGEHMHRALDSRSEIDQAKGIIMARDGCTAEDAFAQLVQQSSAHERKVRDVARTVIARTIGSVPNTSA
jgi:PAS domain-containing protein